MLNRLQVRNFALIDELEVKFGRGLNVLTGSTGAGKSIIVGAIELAIGNRGSDDMIRTGKDSAVVEAEFAVGNLNPIHREKLSEFIRDDDIVIIRREYKKAGGGRAYIGSKQAGLSVLRKISAFLISILGQHSHQMLLDSSTHINYLDNYAGLQDDLTRLRKSYDEVMDSKERLSHAKRNMLETKNRIELLNFQIAEIEKADLRENEEGQLKTEKKLLENSRAIREAGELAVLALLEADGSAVEKVGEADKILQGVGKEQNELAEILGIIGSASDSINEAARKIRNFIDNINDDPGRLEEINLRLQEIFRIRKKYETDVPGILVYLENSKIELRNLQSQTGDPEYLQKELDEKTAGLNRIAHKVSNARKAAKEKLEKSVSGNLSEMGMQKARFVIDISHREDVGGVFNLNGKNLSGDSTGFDVVEFLFCANPGEGLKPLAKIASGGEISRVMLALKNAFLSASDSRCEVFDEIDVGISGEAAARVADQLKTLSNGRQVICITHLHQIASVADHHYKVFKKKAGGRTITMIEELTPENRIREIASLLSGKSITEKAIESAREMIRKSGRL